MDQAEPSHRRDPPGRPWRLRSQERRQDRTGKSGKGAEGQECAQDDQGDAHDARRTDILSRILAAPAKRTRDRAVHDRLGLYLAD